MSGDQARTDGRVPSEADPEPPADAGDSDASDEASPLRSSDPARCRDHGLVHPQGRPWLPKQETNDLAPHPYCTECGEVMGLGRAGGLDRGGLVNLVSRLEEDLERAGHTVTEAQKRLILKRIDEHGVADPFGFTRDTQLSRVSEIASTYLGIPADVLLSYLRSA